MVGYRNAVYNAKEQTFEVFTWAETGERVSYVSKFNPYVYIEDSKGADLSIFNTKIRKKSFNTYFDKLKWIKETGTKRLFENFNPVQQSLIDMYGDYNDTEDFVKFPLKIYFFDIEAVAPTGMGFPSPENAAYPINLINVFDSIDEIYYVWGTGEYKPKQKNIKYFNCATEIDLLTSFIEFIRKNPPDILSGWNSSFFDIPYIVNRIRNILGSDAVNDLSTVNRVYPRTFMNKFGQQQVQWYIEGISCVDYLDIYKRFCLKNRESYRLDFIGETELDERKVDIGDKDLYQLMQTDWNTFVDYNIQDVNLLVKLEVKLQYISLLRMLAYMGLTTFEAAMGTLSVITGASAIRARKNNLHISTFIRTAVEGKNPGAFVAEPQKGFQKNIVSFDANSLYPNVMISLNMSPETKVGKIIESDEESITIRHVNGQIFKLTREKFVKYLKTEDIAVSKAKILFAQKTKGIMPDLVDFYYTERKKVQAELKKCKNEEAAIKEELKAMELT